MLFSIDESARQNRTAFIDGTLVPNTEFGHIQIRGNDAEKRASEHAREEHRGQRHDGRAEAGPPRPPGMGRAPPRTLPRHQVTGNSCRRTRRGMKAPARQKCRQPSSRHLYRLRQ